ncbi:MAG: hypothetical protein AAFX02_04815 [Pseudomonadota bacterium]
MIHPSTRKLIDRLHEMTLQSRIEWAEGDDNTTIYDTEGYRVTLTNDPQEIRLSDALGKELELVTQDALAGTLTDDGTSYADLVGTLNEEAGRIARGTEQAITKVLAGLDLDGDGVPDVFVETDAPEEAEAGEAEEVAAEEGALADAGELVEAVETEVQQDGALDNEAAEVEAEVIKMAEEVNGSDDTAEADDSDDGVMIAALGAGAAGATIIASEALDATDEGAPADEVSEETETVTDAVAADPEPEQAETVVAFPGGETEPEETAEDTVVEADEPAGDADDVSDEVAAEPDVVAEELADAETDAEDEAEEPMAAETQPVEAESDVEAEAEAEPETTDEPAIEVVVAEEEPVSEEAVEADSEDTAEADAEPAEEPESPAPEMVTLSGLPNTEPVDTVEEESSPMEDLSVVAEVPAEDVPAEDAPVEEIAAETEAPEETVPESPFAEPAIANPEAVTIDEAAAIAGHTVGEAAADATEDGAESADAPADGEKPKFNPWL